MSFLSLLHTHTNKITAAAIATIASFIKAFSNAIGRIVADVPTTNNILNILLPTILPIAISVFPCLAATDEVTSSGSEVPNATIVSPISLVDIPSSEAI